MKNYSLVLKILLKSMFRKRSGASSNFMIVMYVLVGFSALLLAGMFGMGVYFIAPYYTDPNVLITYLFIISFFIVIFFSLFSMLAYLYFSKDTEFFLSLPIKPSVIYFAKLTIVYIVELLIVLFVLVPAMLMIGISLSLGVVYYITMLFAVILIPLFPLVFTSLIAVPLMYLVSYLKNKTAVASVLAILLFVGAMCGYMFFTISLQTGVADQSEDGIELMVRNMEAAFPIWGKIFYPFLCLSRFATLDASFGSLGVSMLLNMLIFLGSGLVLFVLAVLISNLVYRRGAAKNLENGTSKSGKGTNVRRSIIKSLIMLEWKEIYRTPAFAFQCLSFVLLCPVMAFAVIMMFRQGEVEDVVGGEYIYLIACSLLAFLGLSTNISAQTALTRMGKTFYYTKIIPVDYKLQVKAKLVLYCTLSLISASLGTLVTIILTPVIYVGICMLIFLATISFATICFSVMFDLKDPKLDWATHNEAIKQNKNVMICTFINMGIAMVLIIMLVIIYALLSLALDAYIALSIAFLLLSGVAVAVGIAIKNSLFSKVDQYFARLS